VITDLYPHEKNPAPKGPTEPYPKETKLLRVVMREYLRDRNLSYDVAAIANDWYPTKLLDGIPRIVVPAQNLDGHRYWQARAMVPCSNQDRWRSATGSKGGSIVIVWPPAITSTMRLVVVEGPMDALAAATTGHLGFAAMGKINLKDVVHYIKTGFNFVQVFQSEEPVIIVPDLDYTNFGGLACKELALAGIKAEIRLPDFEDLAAMSRDQREALLG